MSSKPSLSSPKPIHWVLDWDGTITKKDTLNALVNIAASSKPDFPTHERWMTAVEAYMTDYTAKIAQLTPDNTFPSNLEAESALLKALKPVEQASIDRVSALQIFKDVTPSTIHDGAAKAISSSQVTLRPGIHKFLNRFHHTTSILSVNWSREFISSCLSSATTTAQHISPSSIYANELDGIAENKPSSGKISPGDNIMKIISSDDKLRHLNTRIRAEHAESSIIYVGDSWTDIECLIDAHLGICIRDEPMGSGQKQLADAFERLGVECRHISELENDLFSNGVEKKVVWARDFEDVLTWVDKT